MGQQIRFPFSAGMPVTVDLTVKVDGPCRGLNYHMKCILLTVVLVMFRVIAVYPNLKPYKGSLDIMIYVSMLTSFNPVVILSVYYISFIISSANSCELFSAVTISLFPTSIDLDPIFEKDRDLDRFRSSYRAGRSCWAPRSIAG